MLPLFFVALASLIFTSPVTPTALARASSTDVSATSTSLASVAAHPPRAKTVRASTTPAKHGVPTVPFFSQFTNIASPRWQKVGCGITDLTMLIHYYRPSATVSVNTMLKRGIAQGAYDYNAGWIYQGLINLSKPYGLTGSWRTLPSNPAHALAQLKTLLAAGPVILSVHYQFNPKSTIPHLVVIDGIAGNSVYVNDPATTKGTQIIPLKKFLAGWKRRVIIIRPANTSVIS